MIGLIADSGSSKTDWVLIDKNEPVLKCQTAGFNPYFQTAEQIQEVLKNSLCNQLGHISNTIDFIFFYGSGCSNDKNCLLVKEALKSGISKKAKIEVAHDLLAAARAICSDQAGIAAILGTGSNSCLYNGKAIVENIPSAGYLWSDHGGGSQIGKFFIRDYFEGELPEDIKSKFELSGYNRENILENVYKVQLPSKYLATVSRFMKANEDHPHVRKVLLEAFRSFFTQQIMKYSNSRQYTIGMVGSVAHVYQELIGEVAHDFGYQLGKVLKSPIDGLIEYHTRVSISE